jgi:hypothetical protein
VLLAAVLVARHEPWFDEAQAWLLARDAGPAHLFLRQLHYEGTPGLWHALLMVPAKLGLPYWTMNVLSALLGSLAVLLVVRCSPFPWPVKLLLPFSYFVFYQYAVVARNYSLLAPLLFLVAVVYPRRFERVYLYVGLLALTANLSGHGAMIAGSLMALHGVETLRRWRSMTGPSRRAHLVAFGAFTAVAGFIAFQLLPIPADLDFPHGFPVRPETLAATAGAMIDGALGDQPALTLFVLAVCVAFMVRARTLAVYLLPTVAVVVFATFAFRNVWHDGILFLLLVFGLWVAMTARPEPARGRWQVLLLVAIVPLLALHVTWSVRSFVYDVRSPYSGSRELAAFLRDHPRARGAVVYGTGFASFAVMPYLDHNPFANYNDGELPVYWPWSTKSSLLVDPERIVARGPDLVVLTIKFPGATDQLARYPGYRLLASFPGHIWWKDRILEPDTYVVLERVGRSEPPPPAALRPPAGSADQGVPPPAPGESGK